LHIFRKSQCLTDQPSVEQAHRQVSALDISGALTKATKNCFWVSKNNFELCF
jgi:hypothetical protein